VDVSSFIHATEDPDKVIAACRNVLPADYADEITFERRDLLGHYRNPITLLRARIKQKQVLEAFIENLAGSLSDGEKRLLSSDVSRRIDDKGALYLRLDKQEAFQGQMKLGNMDPIRITLKLVRRRKSLEETIAFYRSLGLL
jgi:RNA binding exosome subunit